jgi:hypothetical protein
MMYRILASLGAAFTLACGWAFTARAKMMTYTTLASLGIVVPWLMASSCEKRTSTTGADPETSVYVMPSELTLEISAERGSDGKIFIVGSTNLPDGTKIGAEVPIGQAQDYSMRVSGGKFRSVGFSDHDHPLSQGPHKIRLLSYFNEAWQTPETLKILGKGGSNLKGKLFKREDSEVVDSNTMLDAIRTVQFPALSSGSASSVAISDMVPIGLVKKAILTVDGSRSATDVETNIALFMKSPGLKPAAGWSAKNTGGTKYTVLYSFINGDLGEEQAIWEVDVATKKIQYVNKNAKNFSWTPKD